MSATTSLAFRGQPGDPVPGEWCWGEHEGDTVPIYACVACGGLVRLEKVGPTGRVLLPNGYVSTCAGVHRVERGCRWRGKLTLLGYAEHNPGN